MPQYQLNVIVCTDPRRCLQSDLLGRNGIDVLEGLQEAVRREGLEGQVQITECRCIFGCTYGPRIDVARRWSGEKLLYGSVEGTAGISRRGRVRFNKIPQVLSDLILDNLPQKREESGNGERLT